MEQYIEFASNHPVLSIGWVSIVLMIAYSFLGSALSKVKELSTHEATLLINKNDAVVVDIRQSNEFKKGHILGAKLLGQEQQNKADFATLEKSKEKPIIVVCAMGMTGKRTANQMLKAGFSQVSILKGGMNSWLSAGLPVSK
ncbi:rhodanese-like domain-containing protein [Alteromonadaceae bacterium M269]|nr:rhodanese-like domain-containing protein [Alteromonadaceae bacterium M269]